MSGAMTTPERIWPVRGYAPGTYWCNCTICNTSFLGDKRAFNCHDCVIKALSDPAVLAELPEVKALVADALDDAANRVALDDNAVERGLIVAAIKARAEAIRKGGEA